MGRCDDRERNAGSDGKEDDEFILYIGSDFLFYLLCAGVYAQIRQQVLSCMGGRGYLPGDPGLHAAL